MYAGRPTRPPARAQATRRPTRPPAVQPDHPLSNQTTRAHPGHPRAPRPPARTQATRKGWPYYIRSMSWAWQAIVYSRATPIGVNLRLPQATRKGWPYYRRGVRAACGAAYIVGPPLAGGLSAAGLGTRVAWGGLATSDRRPTTSDWRLGARGRPAPEGWRPATGAWVDGRPATDAWGQPGAPDALAGDITTIAQPYRPAHR